MVMLNQKKHCFIFLNREVNNLTIRAYNQVKDYCDFYSLAYNPNGSSKDEKIIPTKFGFDYIECNEVMLRKTFSYCDQKINSEDWKVMPGNLDLCHLYFMQIKSNYDYYWFCEDDVVYTGNLIKLLETFETRNEDLICTNIRPQPKGWTHAESLIIPNSQAPTRMLGFLPFFRVSKTAGETILEHYRKGWSGHHEISWPMIMLHSDLKIIDLKLVLPDLYTSNLKSMGLGSGTFVFSRPKLNLMLKKNKLYHPVKPINVFLKRYFKLIRNLLMHYSKRYLRFS
jgi:hypothetical protein